jgi:hypothetical protein
MRLKSRAVARDALESGADDALFDRATRKPVADHRAGALAYGVTRHA